MFENAKIMDAPVIAELMLFAMKDIAYDFIGEKNPEKAKLFLQELIEQTNNQYSYQNTTVLTKDNKIIGSFTLYEGKDLHKLVKPVLELLKNKYNNIINPEDETQDGEIYIDTIAVNPEYRGMGYGNKILDYIINEVSIKKNIPVGLLVNIDNPKAKKLYESKGFKVVGKKKLLSENFEHMQYIP